MADPVTGLTARDREVILETWDVVGNKGVVRERAVDLLVGLFEAHPHMLDYFADFKDMTIEELKTSSKLRNHSIRVMNGLQHYVDAINDVPKLAERITRMANSHLPRGIGVVEMDRLAVVFLGYMKVHVGDRWTDEAAAAWTQLLKVHNVVYKGIEDQTPATD